MKKKFCALLVAALCAFIFSGCNESGNIWAKYSGESFCATLRYEQDGEVMCARVSVTRAGDGDEISVEFSSPDALRGATVCSDGEDFRLTCGDIEISGESAKRLVRIPAMLAERDALSFEKLSEGERRLLVAEIPSGTIFFDLEAEKPIRAELDGVVFEIITFTWTAPT